MGAIHALRVESPYNLLKIVDIKIKNKPNEHGYLYLKCLIDDSINFDAAIKASTDDKICVYEELEDNEINKGNNSPVNINEVDKRNSKRLFYGVVQNASTTNTDGVYYLEIEALTSSFEMDIKDKSRSFQNAEMTYDELIQIILKDYPSHMYSQCIGQGKKIGKPLFQFKETDWTFLKRIASELKSELYSDVMEVYDLFYFGRPDYGMHEIEDMKSYKVCKKLQAFRDAGGYDAGYDDTDYFYYELERREQYNVGDDINFRGKKLYVNQYSAYAIKDEVIYKYKLCRKNGVWQAKLYNSLLQGAALEGKVIAREGEKVKLHLNIDKEQNEDEAAWFPFAPPTGNIMYCMPILGTGARLYFPNESSEKPIVTGCVRSNGESCQKTSNTTKRYLGTEHGSEIEMTPNALNVRGKEPVSVSFDDNTGVTITSHKKLTINADDDIIMKTPKNVKITATSQLLAVKAGAKSGFSMETDVHFLSNNVIRNGRDREAFAPIDNTPSPSVVKQQQQPKKEEKKGFDWGKLAVAAVVAVAVVASVLTFGLGTTLAVAAVGAVVICGAAGAVQSAKNSIDSQMAKNGKVDYGEVIKSGFFGAVTGATNMAKTEACAVYDELNQFGSFAFDVCTLGYYHDSCKNFSKWSHNYFREKSPYKEGYDWSEFVIDVAMLADGANSFVNMAQNLPKKFSVGELSLAELGIKVPVVCADGSVVLATSGDLASIGGAGSAMYNMTSNSNSGSGGTSTNFDNYDPKTGTKKQNGNFGEAKSSDSMLNDQKIKDDGYDLESVGRDAPTSPDDKIVKGIDGLYRNKNTHSNIKYVIDEAKFGSSKLGTTKDGLQMSNDWLTGTKTGNDRILKAVGGNKKLAKDIANSLDDGKVERVLSKVDSDGNVTTYRLDADGKVIGVWP